MRTTPTLDPATLPSGSRPSLFSSWHGRPNSTDTVWRGKALLPRGLAVSHDWACLADVIHLRKVRDKVLITCSLLNRFHTFVSEPVLYSIRSLALALRAEIQPPAPNYLLKTTVPQERHCRPFLQKTACRYDPPSSPSSYPLPRHPWLQSGRLFGRTSCIGAWPPRPKPCVSLPRGPSAWHAG